jgi:hypothetical protein
MDYIDKDTFERYVDKAFELGIEERNAVYHKILEIIDNHQGINLNPVAASEITLLFAKILEERKNEIEYKAAEKSEGNLTPGIKGIFRRIG